MSTVVEDSHPNDVLLGVLVSCRRSVDRFTGLLESVLDDAETVKKCGRCKESKPLAEFSACAAAPDGHQYYCKPCANGYNREYSQSEHGREANRQKMQRYRQTESGKESHRRSSLKYKGFHPRQKKAHNAVNYAVRAGVLPHVSEKTCTDCGEQAQHYHHESYEKADWLKVIPLCSLCHKARHPEEILE